MALICCPECGKEISDKSTMCIHCGYPIASEQISSKKHNTSSNLVFLNKIKEKFISQNKQKNMLTAIIAIAVVVLAITSVNKIDEIKKEKAYQAEVEAKRQAYQNMLVESRNNITPYLELIPYIPDDTGKITLSSELYNNLDNVEFLGLNGSISFSKNDYGVFDTVSWRSHDFFTFDEHQEFVSLLNDYFGATAKLDHYLIGQWTQKDYYWEDDSVPTVVVFYTSVRANHEQDTDRIEIYWDRGAEMP